MKGAMKATRVRRGRWPFSNEVWECCGLRSEWDGPGRSTQWFDEGGNMESDNGFVVDLDRSVEWERSRPARERVWRKLWK